MSQKADSNKKIFFILVAVLVILIIVWIKIPKERYKVQKVTPEEYRTIIYDEVKSEVDKRLQEDSEKTKEDDDVYEEDTDIYLQDQLEKITNEEK